MSFHPRWDPEIESQGPIRMTWEIEPADDGGSKLTVTSALVPNSKAAEEFAGGIVYIVSGLKTFVETGEPLPWAEPCIGCIMVASATARRSCRSA